MNHSFKACDWLLITDVTLSCARAPLTQYQVWVDTESWWSASWYQQSRIGVVWFCQLKTNSVTLNLLANIMVQAPWSKINKNCIICNIKCVDYDTILFWHYVFKVLKSEKVKCGLTTISHSQGRNIYRARFLNNINKCITAAAHNSGPATWRLSPNDPGTWFNKQISEHCTFCTPP